jgi:hypothetical protein
MRILVKKMDILGDVCNSWSASFNLQQNRLAVTINNSDQIEVYDLS